MYVRAIVATAMIGLVALEHVWRDVERHYWPSLHPKAVAFAIHKRVLIDRHETVAIHPVVGMA